MDMSREYCEHFIGSGLGGCTDNVGGNIKPPDEYGNCYCVKKYRCRGNKTYELKIDYGYKV